MNNKLEKQHTYREHIHIYVCGLVDTAKNLFEILSKRFFAVSTFKLVLLFVFIFSATPQAHALVLSGTLYSDEGVTTITSGKTIAVAVGTTTTSLHTTTSNGSGVWSVDLGGSHSIVASTPIVVWVDGDASTRATLFTKASTTNDINNLNLFQDRVIISHEGTSGTSTTLSNLAFYDFDNDNDIQYAATSSGTTTGSLTVFKGNKLYIAPNKTFTASGTVTINANATASTTDGSFHLADGATYIGGGTLTIGGSFTASTTATFTHNGYSTMMNATTTGKTINVPLISIGALSLSGSGGGWTMSTTSTTTSLSVGQGTFIAPASTLAVTSFVNIGTTTHNAGTLTVNGYADQTTADVAAYLAGRDAGGDSASTTGGTGIQSLVTSGNYLYVGKDSNPTACSQVVGFAAGCELMVFDISSSTNPTYVAGRDATGNSDGSGSNMFRSLAISGNYLYAGKAADATACSQTAGSAIGCEIMVFDISSSTNPIYVAGRDTSGGSASTSAITIYSLITSGTSLYVSKDANATACSQVVGFAAGCELMVFDISSSTNPTYVAGRDTTGDATGVGSVAIQSLTTSGNFLYVGKSFSSTACSQTAGSAIGCEIMVFDISSSTNPIYKAGRDASGSSNGTGNGIIYSLVTTSNYLYVGQSGISTACSQTAGSAIGCELMVFDISSSTNPIYKAGRDALGSSDGSSNLAIRGITASGNYLYVAHDKNSTACSQTAGLATGCELMVFDISSSSVPVYVTGRDVSGGSNGSGDIYLYTLTTSGNYLYIGKSGNSTACSQTAGSADGCELMVFNRSALATGYLTGTLTGTSSLNTLYTNGIVGMNRSASTSASTTSFTIQSGTTTAPMSRLTISGNYTNNGVLTTNDQGVIYFSSTSAQTLSGAMTDTSQLREVSFLGSGTKTISSPASTTNLTINTGTTVVAPSSLTIGGNYTNSGTFTHNSGLVDIKASISDYLAGRDSSGSAAGTLGPAINAFAVMGNYLYAGKSGDSTACSQTAGSADGCELVVFDISSSTNPIYVAGRDASGSSASTSAISIYSLITSGTSLYVGKDANATACSQVVGFAAGCELMVFDISSSTNPIYVAGRDASGDSVGVGAGSAIFFSLTTSGNYLYAGKGGNNTACSQTAGSAIGCELMVFDISSTTNPVYVSGRDTSGNSDGTSLPGITTLTTFGNYLYVGKNGNATACSQTSGSADGCELMVFDISSTTNPIYVAGTDGSGSDDGSVSTFSFNSISIYGNFLYGGGIDSTFTASCSQTAGGADGCELQVYDITSPTNPIYVAGRDSSGDSEGTSYYYIYSLAIYGNYLYVGKLNNSTACSQTAGLAEGCELMVFDISSTTNPIYVAGRDASGSRGGGNVSISSLTISQNHLYVGKVADATACSQTVGAADGCELMVFRLPAQVAGTATGTSAFNDLSVSGAGILFATTSSASTTDLTINAGATLVAPALLSISGDYNNAGTFTSGTGTTIFSGVVQQTATGTMIATSSFYNLNIVNTSGAGSSTQSIIFNAPVAATGTLTMIGSTSVQFLSNATSSFRNISLQGVPNQPVWIRSTTPGEAAGFEVYGTQDRIDYVNVRDSNACSGYTDIAAADDTSYDAGNNTCWVFTFYIDLSGTLYSDEGATAQGGGVVLNLVLGTSTPSVRATTTAPDGTYVFEDLPGEKINPALPIMVYIDGDTLNRAVAITKASSTAEGLIAPITGLDLYEDRVLITHESDTSTSTTIADLAVYDGDNDSDIQYIATTTPTTSLIVRTGNELHVKSGKTFAPGGPVTISANATASTTDGSFHLPGTATYTAGGTLTLGGHFSASSTATYSHNGYSLVMDATTTGKTIDAPIATLGALNLRGVGGAWSFTQTSATTSALTVATGTLTVPSSYLTTGSLSNSGVFTNNSSNISILGDTTANGSSTYLVGRDSSGSGTGTLGPAIQAFAVSSAGNYLYVAKAQDVTACTQASGSADGCELVVFDISSTTNPTFLRGIDSDGSATSTTGGPSALAVAVSGNYLYFGKNGDATACTQSAGTADGCELMVFDISSTTNPIYVAGRDAEGDSASTSAIAINSLVVVGNYLYVGKAVSATACSQTAGFAVGCELMVFDISTPTSPTYVAGRDSSGSAAGTLGPAIQTLLRNGDLLYVGKGTDATACSQTSGSADGCEFTIFDISSTTDPTFKRGIDSDGSATGTLGPVIQALSVSGNYLYIGKGTDATACAQTTGSADGCELMVYDISSTTNPLFMKGVDSDGSVGGVWGPAIQTMTVTDNVLYVGKAQDTSFCFQTPGFADGCELMAFDIASSTNPIYAKGTDSDGSIIGTLGPSIFAFYSSGGHLFTGKNADATACSQTAGSADGCELSVFNRAQLFSGTIAGAFTGANALSSTTLTGLSKFTAPSASTTNLTIVSGTGTAPEKLTIMGDYANSGIFSRNPDGTVFFEKNGGQTLSGSLVGSSTLPNVLFLGSGTKTLSGRASTSALSISSGVTLVASSSVTIAGNYANEGTYTNSDGIVDIRSYVTDYLKGFDSEGDTASTSAVAINAFATVGNYLYVGRAVSATACSQVAGLASGCELMVFDISSTTNPVFVAGRDSSGSASGTLGPAIQTLTVVGNYLYVGKAADATPCAQSAGGADGCELTIFDISSTTDPVFVAGRDSSGNATGTLGPTINSFMIIGNFLYVGKAADATPCAQSAGGADGCELTIFDISSTTDPIFVRGIDSDGSATGTLGPAIQSFVVNDVGSYLYIGKATDATACAQSTGGADGCELLVYDISSTTDPRFVAGRDSAGNATSTLGSSIQALLITGNYLYMGKATDATACSQIVGSGRGCELSVFDISSTTNPLYIVGRDSDGSSTGTLGPTIFALTISGNTLYVGKNAEATPCTQSPGLAHGCELTMFDISSTTNPIFVEGRDSSGSETGVLGPAVQALIFPNDHLYMGKGADATACTQVVGSGDGCELMVFRLKSQLTGSMTGTSAFNDVTVTGRGAVFLANASTSDFTVATSSALTAPTTLSLTGNFTQRGTFTHGSGTVVFNGTSAQTATGTMNATSSFYSVNVQNGTASTTFYAPITTVYGFTASTPGAKISFAAGATTTLGTTTIAGESGNRVRLRSATPGTQFGFDITGPYSITYTDVKDSHACDGGVDIDATGGTNLNRGNNSCWSFVLVIDPLTMTGTLYSDEGVTQYTAGETITVAVGTSTLSIHSTTTDTGSGAWMIELPDEQYMLADTPMVIYVDGDANFRASHFTLATSTGNIAGLDLYKDRVIVSHGTTSTEGGVSITNMSFYDGEDDGDIQYVATTSPTVSLTVRTGNELHIREDKHFNPGGAVTINANATASTTDGSLHLPSSSIYTAGGETTLGGSLRASSTAMFVHNSHAIFMNATTTGKEIDVSATSSLGAIAFNGVGGAWSFTQTNATTTAFTIGTGTVSAPSGTLLTGSFANGGTFTHNSGTTTFMGTSTSMLVGGDGVNSSWADATYETVYSLVSHDDKLYAGVSGTTAGESEVWEYNGATWSQIGGDGMNSSWADATYKSVYSLASYNNMLYAGLGNAVGDAEVWEYNGATWTEVGGDAVNSSWADATFRSVTSMDVHNGKLYAGIGNSSGGSAEVWEYNGSSWTRVGGDALNSSWADATYEYVYSLTSHNRRLYAGLGFSTGESEVWEYNGSSWNQIGGDGINSSWADATYEYVFSLTSHNGKLYAGVSGGTDGESEVWEYNGSSWNQIGGDGINFSWADMTYETVQSLNSHNGKLYAGVSGSTAGESEVWEYNGSSWTQVSGDGINSSWVDSTYEIVYSLVSYNDRLYAGLGYSTGDAEVWEIGETITGTTTGTSAFNDVSVTGNVTFIPSVASTSNVYVASNATVTAPSSALDVAGNYRNDGTFENSDGTVYFSGASSQSLGGTMTGSSTFASTTFRGAGTKTFTDNASTTYFTIESTSGAVVAPSVLSIDKNYANAGTFTAGSGVVYMTGTIASSSLVGGDGVNSSWADEIYSSVQSLTSHSGKLYAGAYGDNGVEVWEYNGSSWTQIGGDSLNSSWAGLPYEYLHALTSYNDKLYAGLGGISAGNSEVWEYNGSSWGKVGGDGANSSWADATYEYLYSLTTHNGKLYAGVSGEQADDAEVWEYNGSSWGKVGGDGTDSSWTGGYQYVRSLSSYNGKLYAGLGYDTGSAEVWEYNGATWTQIGGDAVSSSWADATYGIVPALVTNNNKLYAGIGHNIAGMAEVWEYNGSSWTQVGGDGLNSSWADATYEYVQSLTSHNGRLYAGLSWDTGHAEVWEYNGATWSQVGGDGLNSSWADATYEYVQSLTSHNGRLYAGLAEGLGEAEVWEFGSPVLAGTMVGSSAFNDVTIAGTALFLEQASTSDLTITGYSLTAPTALTIGGDFTNSGIYYAGTNLYLSSGSSQALSGTLVATSSLGNVTLLGSGTKTFSSNASTTDLTIGAGTMVAPSVLTITGDFTNSGTFTHNSGTVYFSSTTAQTLTGTMTGSSAFASTTFLGTSTKTFANNASTSNLTIDTGATMVAPTLLSISGNYANYGTTTFASGTTTFNGTSLQTATGTMTATSSFYNLSITNTTGTGSTTQSVTFNAPIETVSTYSMIASTSVAFLAGATSTLENINLQGTSTQYVWLRSTIADIAWGLSVAGNQEIITYVNVKDSNACSGNPNIDASDGTSVDADGNTCWDFTPTTVLSISSASDQTFSYNGATTTISTITLTDATVPTMTGVNDIRIKIATSTVNMHFDTTDATPTFGGTASGKVSGTVSYEGDGSVLVIDVTSDFAEGDTLTIDDLSYTNFSSVNATAVALRLYNDGADDVVANATDDKTVTIIGTLALSNHTSGQVSDDFRYGITSGIGLYAFHLTPSGEDMSIASIVLRLTGIRAIAAEDVTSVSLYRDLNNDQVYDAGDVAVGGAGAVSISGQTGTITFSTTFSATTSQDYIIVADVAGLSGLDMMSVGLDVADIVVTSVTTAENIVPTGAIGRVQHINGSAGAGGSGSAIGGPPPAGDGIQSGGEVGGGDAVDPDSGDTIGHEAGFEAPSAQGTPYGNWTNGGNAYSSDGSYATANSGVAHSYGNFGFSVPSNNTITGIAVKLEASASTEAGDIEVSITWDGETYVAKTTDTLTTTDAVYELGGPSDMWGHAWTPAEVADGTFEVQVYANPSGNTVRIDALQVRVYHQATGGGGGGGGAVFKEPTRYFANVYTGMAGVLRNIKQKFTLWQ